MAQEADNVTQGKSPAEEKLYLASQWRLMWWKFLDHRLALVSLFALGLLYLVAILCEFVAPCDPARRSAA